MPHSAKLHVRINDRPDLACVFVKWHGVMAAEATAAQLIELAGHPSVIAGSAVFHDLREAIFDLKSVDPEIVARRVTRSGLWTGKRKVANLVKNDLDFGIMRKFLGHRRPEADHQVFRRFEDAVRFLGLPPDTPDPFAEAAFATPCTCM